MNNRLEQTNVHRITHLDSLGVIDMYLLHEKIALFNQPLF